LIVNSKWRSPKAPGETLEEISSNLVARIGETGKAWPPAVSLFFEVAGDLRQSLIRDYFVAVPPLGEGTRLSHRSDLRGQQNQAHAERGIDVLRDASAPDQQCIPTFNGASARLPCFSTRCFVWITLSYRNLRSNTGRHFASFADAQSNRFVILRS
jgi:hypothetical protein